MYIAMESTLCNNNIHEHQVYEVNVYHGRRNPINTPPDYCIIKHIYFACSGIFLTKSHVYSAGIFVSLISVETRVIKNCLD